MITYPIVETFASIQGEGRWTGTPMYFIRFAGCPVSRDGVCTSWDGHPFQCDTDIQVRERLSAQELVSRAAGWERICFTGGEPLVHDLTPLMLALHEETFRIFHIETSGIITAYLPQLQTWLTVSPKDGYFLSPLVNELKVLVGKETDMSALDHAFRDYVPLTYVQPIGNKDSWDMENVQRCIAFVLEHPEYKLSVQLHKVLKVR